MDLLQALRLQTEWGADEALLDTPQDRRAAATPPPVAAVVKPVRRSTAKTPGLPGGPAEAAAIAQACNSLDELRAALASFTGCPLRDTATQLVFADGPDSAELMLIGEAPGAEEDRQGRPFAGPEGQLLDQMLASIGLNRETVRMATAVPWRPPGNRAPTDGEVAICLPFLRRHIALVRPRLLLLLGAVAAKAILPEPQRSLGIRRVRGNWLNIEIAGLPAPLPCLPSWHPGYLIRTPSAKREAWADFISLRETLQTMKTA